MKIIFLTLLLAAVALASPRALCNPGDDHDLHDGCKKEAPIALRRTIQVDATFLKVNTRTLRFPDSEKVKEITCIRVTNLVGDNSGGCPSIEHGGSGFKEVSLKFISQRSRKMEFLVEIFAELEQ